MTYDGIQICGRDDRDLAASGDRPKWPTNRLTWAFRGPLLTGFSADDLRGAIDTAWQRWSNVADIRATYNEQSPNVVIGFRAIDGPAKVLAFSELADGTMRTKQQTYDSGERFVISDNPPPDRIDLIRVACHELGHVLGVPHIATGNLMAPTYSQMIRGPQSGDVAEMMARYGPPTTKPPPDQPPPPSGTAKRLMSLEERDGSLWLVTATAEWRIGQR